METTSAAEATAALSERERRKLEQTAALERDAASRDLSRRLKAALRESSLERSSDARELLATHPVEADKLRAAAAKASERAKRVEVNATEVEEDDRSLSDKVARLAEMLRSAKHGAQRR